MTAVEAMGIFERNNAIKYGHFVLRGDDHTKYYVDKSIVFQDISLITQLCYGIAGELLYLKLDPDIIIGPQMGGALMAQWVTHYLSRVISQHKVFSLYAEKGRRHFKLRPQAAQLIRGKKIVIVDDVLQRGTSVSALIETINKAKGIVVGIGVLWHRGPVDLTNLVNRSGEAIKFACLIRSEIAHWSAWPNDDQCPLCYENIPVNADLGYGKEFLRQKRNAARFINDAYRLETT